MSFAGLMKGTDLIDLLCNYYVLELRLTLSLFWRKSSFSIQHLSSNRKCKGRHGAGGISEDERLEYKKQKILF